MQIVQDRSGIFYSYVSNDGQVKEVGLLRIHSATTELREKIMHNIL
jgi:hypothetical protein